MSVLFETWKMISCGSRVLTLNRQFIGISKQRCDYYSNFNRHFQHNKVKDNILLYNKLSVNILPKTLNVQSKCNFYLSTIKKTSGTSLNEDSANISENKESVEVAVPENTVDPLNVRDYFEVNKLFTIKDLFNARVHLGHTVRSLTTQMRPFIFGTRFDTCIFDLDETALLLRQALNFIAHISHKGGIVLFVSRQPQMAHMVERTAIECGEYAVCRQWNTEIFTAPNQTFGGEVRLPDLIILLHTKVGTQYMEHQAIIDAAKVSIPTVAIVDSDCNPNLISYPIPGNDDTLDSQQLYLHLFKQAILLGKKKRLEEKNLENA